MIPIEELVRSAGSTGHRVIRESSASDGESFIELPNNPYLNPSYVQNTTSSFGDHIYLTPDEERIRHTDPETFLYLMMLKKMPPNPNAKVTQKTKHEFWVDMEKYMTDPAGYGQLKTLFYEKIKRAGKDSEFKNNGVIHEESFEFDEMKRRRNEYVNYCIKKIVCAIKDEPMPEKDAKKSPLNVQIASSKRRHKKHS